MTFEHRFLPFPQLESVTNEKGRRYVLPSGLQLPSVTTVLTAMADKSWKDDWIAAVGEEEASRIVRSAQIRGRGVHALAEAYLKNEAGIAEAIVDDPFIGEPFLAISEILDKHVGAIYGIEATIFSERLGTAGRLDLFCDWDGRPAIVDFKTSRRFRNERLLHNYFLQATAYAVMIQEKFPRINIPEIVIIVAPEHEYKLQVEIRKKDTFLVPMEIVFSRFRTTVLREGKSADSNLREEQTTG